MAAKRTSGSGKSPMTNIIIVAVALVVFIGAVAMAVSMLGDDKPEASTPEPVQSSDILPEDSEPVPPESEPEEPASSTPASSSSKPTSSSSTSGASSSASSAVPAVFNPNSLGSSGASGIAAAKAKNSDVRGWLKVPGTNISHPVLYHATDVNYYMARDLAKQQSKNGVIWADPDSTFGTASELPKNTVIYGHNWTNVSANPRIGDSSDVMFGQLTAFHHLNFAKVTPYIYYSTEAEEMVWKVFAAFYTDIGFNYIDANPSDATFANVISGAKARSRHNYDVDVKTSDKILTLSTCTRAYGSSDRQRFVVMARLMRSGEDTVAVNITANPNPVLPKL